VGIIFDANIQKTKKVVIFIAIQDIIYGGIKNDK